MTNSNGKPRCAIVLCHPRSDSFCAAVAARAEQAAQAAGYETIHRDLYGIAFDPVMHERDIGLHHGGGNPAADVALEVTLLGDPQLVVLVYPIWFGSAPALLKGYIERVLGAGFAGPGSVPLPAGPRPELLVTIATSGSTADWIEEKGIAASAGSIFGAYLAGALAIANAEHIAVDNVIPTMSPARGAAALDRVEQSLRAILHKDRAADAPAAAWPAAETDAVDGAPKEPAAPPQAEG